MCVKCLLGVVKRGGSCNAACGMVDAGPAHCIRLGGLGGGRKCVVHVCGVCLGQSKREEVSKQHVLVDADPAQCTRGGGVWMIGLMTKQHALNCVPSSHTHTPPHPTHKASI